MRDAALGDGGTHSGAGDEFAVDDYGINDVHGKSEARAQFRERFDVSLLAMAKMKILADQDGRRF